MSITRVNTNFDAIFATNALKQTERQLQNAMARIATGKRINYASDDPAGVGQLTIAKAQLSGARVSQQNAQESLALLQFADGVMQTFEDKLIELRDVCIEGMNSATLSDDQASALAGGYNTAIATTGILGTARMATMSWNGKTIFDGANGTLEFAYGGGANDTFTLTIAQLDSTTLAVTATLGVTAATMATTAATALAEVDAALVTLAGERSNVGTGMMRLEYALEEQMTAETNFAAAVSSIGDADMASEISRLTTSQILSQSAAAMLGQANIHSQTLLNVLL